jgi:hypothetical protein
VSDPVLLTRQQINDTHWNALLDASPHPVIYAYSWYLDVVSPHWQALVVVAHTGYDMIMPLPVLKKWGFRVVQQPFFCQYLGIYSHSEVSQAAAETFLNHLNRHFRYISTYAFHPQNTAALADVLARQPDIRSQKLFTHWLELEKMNGEPETIYNHDRKTNLRKANNHPWKMISSENTELLVQLFRHNHQQQIQGGVSDSAYKLLGRLAHESACRKALRIYYAELEEEIHAGIMVLQWKGTGIYIFNAADAVGRKGNARTWLLNRYFTEKKGSIRYFDFETPPLPSIAQFYASFGAEERVFYAIQKNKLPFPLRQLQNWRKQLLIST